MPNRPVPFLLEGRHEVRPEVDFDWTLCPGDWCMELRRRQERNLLIKANLKDGRNACYRSSGWSLWPTVRSNDQCTYEPVTRDDQVVVGDIVFCEVMRFHGDTKRFYAHRVKAKDRMQEGSMQGKYKFTIANMQGRENGFSTIDLRKTGVG